jgi:hypothetical protein
MVQGNAWEKEYMPFFVVWKRHNLVNSSGLVSLLMRVMRSVSMTCLGTHKSMQVFTYQASQVPQSQTLPFPQNRNERFYGKGLVEGVMYIEDIDPAKDGTLVIRQTMTIETASFVIPVNWNSGNIRPSDCCAHRERSGG